MLCSHDREKEPEEEKVGGLGRPLYESGDPCGDSLLLRGSVYQPSVKVRDKTMSVFSGRGRPPLGVEVCPEGNKRDRGTVPGCRSSRGPLVLVPASLPTLGSWTVIPFRRVLQRIGPTRKLGPVNQSRSHPPEGSSRVTFLSRDNGTLLFTTEIGIGPSQSPSRTPTPGQGETGVLLGRSTGTDTPSPSRPPLGPLSVPSQK